MTIKTTLQTFGQCAALSVALLTCTGCLSDPRMAVRPYWGPGMDFDAYGPKFDWAPGARMAAEDRNAPHAHKHAITQEMIETEFFSKGYELSPSQPDFWIRYDIWKTRVGNELGYKNYVDYGGLIVEVIDPESKLLIWRCTAQSRILTSDPPNVWEDKARKTVRGIMKKFPAAGRIDLEPPAPPEEEQEDEPTVMTAAKETPETVDLFDE